MSHVGAAKQQKPGEQCGQRDQRDNDYRTRHLGFLFAWSFSANLFRKMNASSQPFRPMEKTKPVICVFCGSSFGAKPQYAADARALGRIIAERGFAMIFGGGGLGLMGETARAARDNGTHVMGIIPEFLRHIEQPPEWEKDLVITPDLQLRKTRMLAMADAFIVLPGGAGTMDEFFEIVTSAQLGVLGKPIAIVNTDGYFDPLLQLLNHIVREGFARPAMFSLYTLAATPEQAIDTITERLEPDPPL